MNKDGTKTLPPERAAPEPSERFALSQALTRQGNDFPAPSFYVQTAQRNAFTGSRSQSEQSVVPAFDLPFIPDQGYVNTLLEEFGPGLDRVGCLHFSLYDACASDARHAMAEVYVRTMAEQLSRLPGPRKYALLNARFHAREAYGPGGLRPLTQRLDALATAGVLHGIVWADAYLLQALASFSPALAAALEAVPSINVGLDSLDKIEDCLDFVTATGFRQPGKLCLDRAVNRDITRLATISEGLRRRLPDMKLYLLANEGCLRHCPFRPAHEAHIAQARMPGRSGGNLLSLNRELGCQQLFFREPWRVLSSPFIRPEDQGAYIGLVHGLKLCGRTRGSTAMSSIMRAYARGSHAGNLIWLLDAVEGLAQVLRLDNAKLPSDYHRIVTKCPSSCTSCRYCKELSESLIVAREISLQSKP